MDKLRLELAHLYSIFPPSKIITWIVEDNPCDKRGTAICPYCGVDSVIGESSGFPISKEFLQAMRRRWFENDDSNFPEQD